MDSKLVNLDLLPNHPRFLRLPSVSRSLYFSIMPKTCQSMHDHPKVFSLVNKPSPIQGAPVFTPRHTNRKKISAERLIEKPENIRPCTGSYIYRKIFENKPKHLSAEKYYTPPRKHKMEKRPLKKVYYCEIEAPPRSRAWPRQKPRNYINTAQMVFFDNANISLHHIPEVQSNMESSIYTVDNPEFH